jgi:hypothetical protein
MTTTTIDTVMSAIGLQIITRSAALTTANTYYQFDPVTSPYAGESLFINEGSINRKKLLADLSKNTGIFQLVAWVCQETNPPVDLRSDLNALIKEIMDAIKYDQTFGDIARVSEVASIMTDGGIFAEAGKAAARIFLNVTYFTAD